MQFISPAVWFGSERLFNNLLVESGLEFVLPEIFFPSLWFVLRGCWNQGLDSVERNCHSRHVGPRDGSLAGAAHCSVGLSALSPPDVTRLGELQAWVCFLLPTGGSASGRGGLRGGGGLGWATWQQIYMETGSSPLRSAGKIDTGPQPRCLRDVGKVEVESRELG